MAPKKRFTPAWAQQMLRSFTPAQLQAGAFITKRERTRSGKIQTVTYRNRGTGIPASTWVRMQTGQFTPGPRTLEKLAHFKTRYQYNLLRGSGIPKDEAMRFRRMEDLTDVEKIAEMQISTAEELSQYLSEIQGKDIPAEVILAHMAKGERTIEEWDRYTRALSG